MEAGAVHRVADERAIARPDVRVVVVVAPLRCRSRSRRRCRAVAIALRLHDEQRAPVELDDLLRQIAEDPRPFLLTHVYQSDAVRAMIRAGVSSRTCRSSSRTSP